MMSRNKRQVVQYIPRLRRYASALLADVDAAEELVQETLVKALNRLGSWRRGTDMRAWLFSIMHNLYVNQMIRDSKRPDNQTLDAGVGQYVEHSAQADSMARMSDIERHLKCLPEQQRAVLLLVALEGMTYAETAKILDIKKGTVMSRLHRARETLRVNMGEPRSSNISFIRGGQK